ncbi:MAG: nucleotidyltransferase family protein [Bacteroidales bacterium]
MTRRHTYYLIARTLAQMLVKTGSDNMILPSFFLALQRHDLLQHLPEDLHKYLQYMLELNRERNSNVISLTGEVKDLMKAANIPCLFMKGTGNILDGLYADPGERMVYDIDMLVPENKMLMAAKLMEGQGYHTQKKFNPRALESTMHYPILLREDQVAGVEIHRMPVQYLYRKSFRAEGIFENAVESNAEKGFLLMNHSHRIIHNFLHAQLMHSGHYNARVSLRDLYDLLLLSQKEDVRRIFDSFGHYRSKSTAYLKLMHKVFGLEMSSELSRSSKGNFFLWRHERVMKMGGKQLKWQLITIMALQKYAVLPARVLWNRQARNYVFSRLLDPAWYGRHLKAMGRIMKKNS